MQTINVPVVDVDRLQRLDELESEIAAGLEMVYQGGARMQRALADIKDEQLWTQVTDNAGNPVYTSFEHYCNARWHGAERTLRHHAQAGRVANEMIAAGVAEEDLPQRSSQLIALGEVEPEMRPAVLDTAKAEGGGKATTVGIKRAAKQLAKPEVGKTYEVAEGHMHEGKTVTVSQVTGSIAVAEVGGQDFPFMPTELRPTEPPEPKPEPVKLSLRERCALYRKLLEKVLGLPVSEGMKSEIREAMAQP